MRAQETLEGLMIFAFSISWYWSIAQTPRVRAAGGERWAFVAIVCCEYRLGILSKLVSSAESGSLNLLIWLYFWNLMVTFADLSPVLHFGRLDHQAALAPPAPRPETAPETVRRVTSPRSARQDRPISILDLDLPQARGV